MTDEEKLWWEEDKRNRMHDARWFQLRNTYTMFVWEACAYASFMIKPKILNRWTMEELSNYINKWFDRIRDVDTPLEPYALAKERLFLAFRELAEQWSKYPLDDSNLVHCPVCHGELTTAYKEPMVCEHCIQPVLEALDDLVRASTTEWTPEQVRKYAGTYFEV